MQRKHIRKWIPALAILLFVGWWMFATFVIHAPPKKTVVAEFKTYSILKAKDQYYLRIHDMSAIEPKSLSAIPMTSVAADRIPEFISAKHMKDSILGGKLSRYDLYYIWRHCKVDPDYDLFICDPYDIHEPLPLNGLPFSMVCWYGTHYDYGYRISRDYYWSITCYELTEEHNVYTAFDRDLELIKPYILYTEQIEDRNATVYYYKISGPGNDKKILYDLSTQDKPLMILETYNDDAKTIPMRTEVCGIEHGVYFTAYITSYNERPSVEFLQSLGISPEPIP